MMCITPSSSSSRRSSSSRLRTRRSLPADESYLRAIRSSSCVREMTTIGVLNYSCQYYVRAGSTRGGCYVQDSRRAGRGGQGPSRDVSPQDASEEATSGKAVLLDVREPVEWEHHIEGAVQVPRGLLEFVADPTSPRHNAGVGPGRPRDRLLPLRRPGRAGRATFKDHGLRERRQSGGGLHRLAGGRPAGRRASRRFLSTDKAEAERSDRQAKDQIMAEQSGQHHGPAELERGVVHQLPHGVGEQRRPGARLVPRGVQEDRRRVRLLPPRAREQLVSALHPQPRQPDPLSAASTRRSTSTPTFAAPCCWGRRGSTKAAAWRCVPATRSSG